MRKILLAVIGCLTLNTAHAVSYVKTYSEVLPDYEKAPVFTNKNKNQHEELRNFLLNAMPSQKECKVGSVLVWKAPMYVGDTSGKDWRVNLTSNICEPKSFSNIRKLIGKLAPTLNLNNMTAWLVNLEDDNNFDLMVGYIDLSDERPKYPYLSFWRLKLEDGIYKAIYAGPFLDASFYSARNFGENSKNKTIFVKHVSCIECEPTVYLTAIDFDAGKDARAYEFTYNEKHEGFEPTIEFELPGMGHTVEAKVETRLLPPTKEGPHLLQFFKMAKGEGPDEGWVFTCKNYKCDFQLYKGKMPQKFNQLWNRASPLK
ncbi:MAG: hypothetical protein ACXWIN_09785 [Burkholderiaceae bacterium]